MSPTAPGCADTSHMLFDTDLDRAAQLTAIRPLQLAIIGGSGLPILENLADDPHFKGVAIVGMTENAYFRHTGWEAADGS